MAFGFNYWTISGRVGKEPKTAQTKDGKDFIRFSVDTGWRNKNGYIANWVIVQAYDGWATYIEEKKLQPGDMVVVGGPGLTYSRPGGLGFCLRVTDFKLASRKVSKEEQADQLERRDARKEVLPAGDAAL